MRGGWAFAADRESRYPLFLLMSIILSFDKVIREADDLMYKSKNPGRNRIEYSQPEAV